MTKKTLSKNSKFAIATAQAKKSGCKNFKKGSTCAKKRKKIAEGISKKYKITK